MRYFITFACYGNHLHGDERGSVDRNHNQLGTRLLEANSELAVRKERAMIHPLYVLDRNGREVVLHALQEVCGFRGWNLLAAHVRSNHVHAIVDADARPERVMTDFKAYASRYLNRGGSNQKRWARHGSTRWLWEDRDVREAIWYVVDGQGEPMALFVSDGL